MIDMSLKDDEIRRLIESQGISEPNTTLLSDEEILKYAPKSLEACRSRLKLGCGGINDKFRLYESDLAIVGFCSFTIFVITVFISSYVAVAFVIILFVVLLYWFFIRDFTSKKYVKQESDDDLLRLFESKEKIAREMIEKKFPAPQLTNSKFNGVLDNCHRVVKSQIKILSVVTPTTNTEHEISSRKELIRQLIGKVDDLTTELALSNDSFEEVVEEMEDLIHSVKEY